MHHRAKHSNEDVQEARKLRESKPWLWSYRSLAEHFGCSPSTARDWVKGWTRKQEAAA